MKHLTPLLAGTAAALLLAAPAGAKNISELKICGPSACASIVDQGFIAHWEQSGLPRQVAAPPLGAYYRFETTVTAGPGEKFENGQSSMTWTDWYVLRSGTGIFRGTDEADAAQWFRVDPSLNTKLLAPLSGVDPYPAPTITSVRVGSRAAATPASYARLFDASWRRVRDSSRKGWKQIRLRGVPASPWTDGKNLVFYAPARRHLSRDGTVVAVPRSVGNALANARSLPGGGPSNARAQLAAFGIAAAVLAASLVAYRRRRTG